MRSLFFLLRIGNKNPYSCRFPSLKGTLAARAVCAFCLVSFPCPARIFVFLARIRETNSPCMHACLGFASLPKGDVKICLGNVNLKKLKTHNKKLVSHILCHSLSVGKKQTSWFPEGCASSMRSLAAHRKQSRALPLHAP